MKKTVLFIVKFIITLLLIISIYNFSIAIYIFIQEKNINENFTYQFVELEKKENENENYIFSKEVTLLPYIAMYLTNWVKVYICTNSNISGYMIGDSIKIKAKREQSGEKQEYNIIFKPKNEDVMIYDNLKCYAFMTMPLHINFNDIEFIIEGLNIPEAKENLKILLRHESNGGGIILLPHLLRGVTFFILFLLLRTISDTGVLGKNWWKNCHSTRNWRKG